MYTPNCVQILKTTNKTLIREENYFPRAWQNVISKNKKSGNQLHMQRKKPKKKPQNPPHTFQIQMNKSVFSPEHKTAPWRF